MRMEKGNKRVAEAGWKAPENGVFCGGVGSIGVIEYKERGEIKTQCCAGGKGRKMDRGIDKNRLKQSQRQRKREKKRGERGDVLPG